MRLIDAGNTLGLKVCPSLPAATWEPKPSFAELLRLLARSEEPTGGCLAGTWDGRGVLVAQERTAIEWFNGQATQFREVTRVFARIDPPLLASFAVEGVDEGRRTGIDWFDRTSSIAADDPAALERLVASVEHGALATLRHEANPAAFTVLPSAVLVTLASSIDEAAALARVISRAGQLAGMIGTELAPLHDGAWHRDLRATWAALAAHHLLSFDEQRFSIQGALGRAALHLGLEAEPRRITTTLELRLPDGVEFDFVLAPQRGVPFVQRVWTSQDLRVGHRRLDETFVIRTQRPITVKAKLQDEQLAEAFLSLHASAAELAMDATSLSIRWLSPIHDATHLEAVLASAATIAHAFAPGPTAAPAMGPYR